MVKISDNMRKVIISHKLTRYIDLNTDFGQSADRAFFEGKERTQLHYVSSVNIPCGVHDGDPAQILKDIGFAKANNCAIGGHIAYPDPKHFGYKAMDISSEELHAWVLMQLGAFSALCRANNIDIEHVRPHGALYSEMIENEEVALTVAKAVKQYDPWLILIMPTGPVAAKVQSQVEIQVAEEVYLGKRFSSEGVLILDRFSENLHPQGVIEQVKQLITDSSVTTEDGKVVKVRCNTMHLSPKLQGNMMIAERVNAMLGQPVPLSLTAAGSSGWL
jgi:5-oxoprolinase (ATP-hydrolysing) subunit A